MARFTEALGEEPQDAEIYQQRGLSYLALERYREALADAIEATRLEPGDRESLRLRGRACFGVGDYDRAVADLVEITRAERWNSSAFYVRWNAYYWRARALAARGEWRSALADLDKAVSAGPRRAEVFLERSRVYEQLGMTEKAAADRRDAHRLDLGLAEQDLD